MLLCPVSFTGQRARCSARLALRFRIFLCQQFIQLIAADVTEILPLHVVEDVFADILAAVTNTFD